METRDVVLTLETVDRILWCDKYFCRVLFVWEIKKNEIKHFLEFLFWPPVTGSERVKFIMFVIAHDKYLPDNKIDTYLGLVLAQFCLCYTFLFTNLKVSICK